MCFSQIDYIDEIANTRAVRCIVIIPEDTHLLTDTHSCLCDVGYQILRYTQWQFSNLGRWMCADRIKIAKNNTPDRCAGMNEILDNLLVDLFGVAIGRGCRLDRRVLIDGIHVGLAVDSA